MAGFVIRDGKVTYVHPKAVREISLQTVKLDVFEQMVRKEENFRKGQS